MSAGARNRCNRSYSEEVPLQWRKDAWLGKDASDHDLVVADSHEIIRSKAVREAAEVWNANLLIPMCIGDWGLRKSVHKQVKPTEQPATPPPMRHPDVRGDGKKDEKREKPAEKPSEEGHEV